MTCLAAAAGLVSVLYPAKRKLLWALVGLFLVAALGFFVLGLGIRSPFDAAGAAITLWGVITVLAVASMIWLARQSPRTDQQQQSQPEGAVRRPVNAARAQQSPDRRLPVSDPLQGENRKTYEITVTDAVQPGLPAGHLQLLPQVYWTKADPQPIRCRLTEEVAFGLKRDGWKVVEVRE
jgi:hypothetical protein